MIVGPMRTLFMDEISTGLDSSTTYQIVKCLQQSAHLGESTILMSLLQPSPETFDLFDDIILLSEGQIVYQGPREFVLEFFETCGFCCPERKGTADFLQEVKIYCSCYIHWKILSKAKKNKLECHIQFFCLYMLICIWLQPYSFFFAHIRGTFYFISFIVLHLYDH